MLDNFILSNRKIKILVVALIIMLILLLAYIYSRNYIQKTEKKLNYTTANLNNSFNDRQVLSTAISFRQTDNEQLLSKKDKIVLQDLNEVIYEPAGINEDNDSPISSIILFKNSKGEYLEKKLADRLRQSDGKNFSYIGSAKAAEAGDLLNIENTDPNKSTIIDLYQRILDFYGNQVLIGAPTLNNRLKVKAISRSYKSDACGGSDITSTGCYVPLLNIIYYFNDLTGQNFEVAITELLDHSVRGLSFFDSRFLEFGFSTSTSEIINQTNTWSTKAFSKIETQNVSFSIEHAYDLGYNTLLFKKIRREGNRFVYNFMTNAIEYTHNQGDPINFESFIYLFDKTSEDRDPLLIAGKEKIEDAKYIDWIVSQNYFVTAYQRENFDYSDLVTKYQGGAVEVELIGDNFDLDSGHDDIRIYSRFDINTKVSHTLQISPTSDYAQNGGSNLFGRKSIEFQPGESKKLFNMVNDLIDDSHREEFRNYRGALKISLSNSTKPNGEKIQYLAKYWVPADKSIGTTPPNIIVIVDDPSVKKIKLEQFAKTIKSGFQIYEVLKTREVNVYHQMAIFRIDDQITESSNFHFRVTGEKAVKVMGRQLFDATAWTKPHYFTIAGWPKNKTYNAILKAKAVNCCNNCNKFCGKTLVEGNFYKDPTKYHIDRYWDSDNSTRRDTNSDYFFFEGIVGWGEKLWKAGWVPTR